MSLRVAGETGGPIGATARQVLDVIEPHLAREQRLALPALRLLPRMANSGVSADMSEIVAVTDRLRAELPALRAEHVAIKRALEGLWEAAWSNGKPEYAFLAQRVNRHIEIDEEVLYPAALVVGDYVRVSSERGVQRPATE